jgi:hypothetical protein
VCLPTRRSEGDMAREECDFSRILFFAKKSRENGGEEEVNEVVKRR